MQIDVANGFYKIQFINSTYIHGLLADSEAEGASTQRTGGRVTALKPLVQTVTVKLVLTSATSLGRQGLVLMQNRITNGTLGHTREVKRNVLLEKFQSINNSTVLVGNNGLRSQ
jgi:hypothetical protein